MTLQEFCAAPRSGPGADWYWGWQTDSPLSITETCPGFALFWEHSADWPVWDVHQQLGKGMGEYIRAREDLLARICSDAEELTKRTISRLNKIPGGSITPEFGLTVYQWAMRLAQGENVSAFPGYRSDLGIRIPVLRGLASGLPDSFNHPIYLGCTVISWSPQPPIMINWFPSNYSIRPSPHRIHASLTETYSVDPELLSVLAQYNRLCKLAQSIREQLHPAIIRKLLMTSRCRACM
jgi:hypothetical protein